MNQRDIFFLTPITPKPQLSPSAPAIHWGTALWGIIHHRPFAATDIARETDWLLHDVAAGIPCGDCRTDWLKMLAAHPPDLTSPDTYFAWTVAVHNSVNIKLGKPVMSVEAARQIWIT